MTPEEAWEILGVEANAAPEELRRAYLKLVKRHKPDRDPEGFRRLRDAYELARALTADLELAFAVSEREIADVVPERPDRRSDAIVHTDSPAEVLESTDRGPPTPSPEAVESAIQADDHERALSLVMDDAWASQVDSPWFAHATYRVGQMLVLAQPQAFVALEARYADVLESGVGDQLLHARSVSEQWYRFKNVFDVPKPLQRFVERADVADDDERDTLARELTLWFWSDVDAALAMLRKLESVGPHAAGYLLSLVEVFEPDVDACRGELSQLGPQPTPRASLRALLVPGMVMAVFVGIFCFVSGVNADDDSVTAIGRFFRSMMVVGSVLLVLYIEAVVFAHVPSLQARVLRACLAIDQRPMDAAVGFREHLFVCRSIEKNLSLELGWHIGRLARLLSP